MAQVKSFLFQTIIACLETRVDKFYLVFKKCLLMFGGSRSRPSETARPSQAMPPFSPLSTIGSHSNFILETKTEKIAKAEYRKINTDHVRHHDSLFLFSMIVSTHIILIWTWKDTIESFFTHSSTILLAFMIFKVLQSFIFDQVMFFSSSEKSCQQFPPVASRL